VGSVTISLTGRSDPDRFRVEEHEHGRHVQTHEKFSCRRDAELEVDRMLATAPDQYAGHNLVVTDRRSR
jgi:hypothetical protein